MHAVEFTAELSGAGVLPIPIEAACRCKEREETSNLNSVATGKVMLAFPGWSVLSSDCHPHLR